uniref:Cation/H+ exchanger domain-containing protein n=1 Tax=Kalanchoe fedtschenkoi TaxID=63787 RepID=A0A7N0ZZC0_KALFE
MFHDVLRAANGTAVLPLDAPMICIDRTRTKTVGIFQGENPLHFPTPVLIAQLASSSLITALLQLLLAPVGQTVFVCQMLGGFLLGPQALGRYLTFLQSIYRVKSLYVLNTVSFFACALFLFLIGVKTDIRLLAASGRKAIVIGACTFFVPLILNMSVALTVMACVKLEPQVRMSLHFVATLQSASSFYVVASQLEDLKMLTSELGRLALSSSLISGTLSWCWVIFSFATSERHENQVKGVVMGTVLCTLAFMFIVTYVLRPIFQWLIIRVKTTRGVKEGHMFIIYTSVLGLALFGESMGLNFLFGPMIVGIIVPVGPPLGSAVVEKLDTMVSILLLPMFYSIGLTVVNLPSISAVNVGVIELVVLTGFFGKVVGAMVPCVLSKMPVADALSLGLILATQGITDVLMLLRAMNGNLLDMESYSILFVSMLITSGIATPVVRRLYKPPDRYISYKRRTIQHSKPEVELRMVACVYNHDNSPSIINLLELSNPHVQSTICVYLLHLMQQTGSASTLLYAHSRRADNTTMLHAPHMSDPVINAFRKYESRKGGIVLVNAYTAVSPFVTMHEDVCNLALGKRASIIIVPFHKQVSMANEIASAPSVRSVNLNILRAAPCSVAILIDRGTRCGGGSFHVMSSEASAKYKVGVFFLGGQDDREALSYAMRMGENPDFSVTVIHFLGGDRNTSKPGVEKRQDVSLTSEFRLSCKIKHQNTYREEISSGSVEVVAKIRTVENHFDMILVGRRHSTESHLLDGLHEWNEYPELGYIGDMLASTDTSCRASVLVIQQQTFLGDEDVLDSPKHQSERESSTVPKYQAERESSAIDMPRDDARVWPGLNRSV